MDDDEVAGAWEDLTVDRGDDTGMAAAVPLQVPNRVWLSEDTGSVCWSAGTGRMATIDSSPADLLIRFAQLHLLPAEAAAEEVLDLVATYGPLGLCHHGLPAGHLPRRVIQTVRRDLDELAGDTADEEPIWWQWQPCSQPGAPWMPYGKQRGWAGSERVADWLRTSRETAALISAAAATRRLRESAAKRSGAETPAIRRSASVRLPELADLAPLDRLLPAPLDLVAIWTDVTDPDGHRRLVHETGVDRDPIGPRPDDPAEAKEYDRRAEKADYYRLVVNERGTGQVEAIGRELERITQVALQQWLDDGDLRVQLTIDKATGETRMRWGNGGLFSVIAMQMAMTIGGIHALAVCDACRRAYRPAPWPNVGDHLYCEVCRADPKTYAALRKRMSRQAAWPPAE
ncbi:MAG: hypothetical protein ACR2MB_15015 [Acidimicrobiales bacterium]